MRILYHIQHIHSPLYPCSTNQFTITKPYQMIILQALRYNRRLGEYDQVYEENPSRTSRHGDQFDLRIRIER